MTRPEPDRPARAVDPDGRSDKGSVGVDAETESAEAAEDHGTVTPTELGSAATSQGERSSGPAQQERETSPQEQKDSPAVRKPAPAAEDEEKEKKKKKKKKKKKVGTNRGIETMFRTSYRTHLDLSNLADTKANIMMSINGIIISVTIASIGPKIDANPWLLLPTAVLLLTSMVSMVFAILAARPRVSSKVVSLDDVRSNRKNILFFGNFVNMTEETYVTGMKELMADTDRLYSNMIRDIYSLGGVLAQKYALIRRAYDIFMVGLSISVLLFVAVLTWAASSQSFTVG